MPPLAILPPLRLSQVIDACHRNQTIYRVIRLDSVFDIDTMKHLPEQYGIRAQLEELIKRIQVQDLKIWTKDAEIGIDKLTKSELTKFDVHKTLDNVRNGLKPGIHISTNTIRNINAIHFVKNSSAML